MKKAISENFIYNAINIFLFFIIGIALSIVIARSLGPANYGIYKWIVWVLGIVTIISVRGFSNAVEKYVSEYDGRQDRDTIRRIIGFVLKAEFLWGIVVTILFIVLANKLSLWFKHPEFRNLFWVASLIVIPGAISSILASTTRGLQIFKNLMIVNIIILPLSLGFVLFILSRGAGVVGILWVHLVMALLRILIFFLLLKDVLSLKEGLNLDWGIKKKIQNFSLSFLAITGLSSIVWRGSGVFFLGLFRTSEEVGYYGLAFGLSFMAARFVPDAFAGVITPVMSNRYGAQDKDGLNQLFTKSTKYLMLMTAPVCIAIATMARPLVELAYGRDYLSAAGILPVLVVSSGLSVIAYSASGLLYSTEKQNTFLAILVFVTVIGITMDILLIPRYGIYGATIAYSAGQVVGIFLGFSWVHVKMKFKFPLICFLKTFFAGGVAAGIMYLSMSIWGKGLGSLLLLLILGEGIYIFIVCLTQRKDIDELKSYFYLYLKRKNKI